MDTTYTVVGTPFSTFTRAIVMGLEYKGLTYKQIACAPSSKVAFEYHPFGHLPSLVIHAGDQHVVNLYESQAIARYIDRVAPEPSLQIAAGQGGAIVQEKMWELVSLIACFGFPLCEGGFIKLYVQALDEGKLDEMDLAHSHGTKKMKNFLAILESLMYKEGFAYGEKPSWADFFLYPIFADLKMTPGWDMVSPRLKEWMEKMDALPAAIATRPGTLSVGARLVR